MRNKPRFQHQRAGSEQLCAREPEEKTESNYIPNCLLKLVEITHNSMCATAL